jgi:hypothetical protein
MFDLFLNPWAMTAGTLLISSPIIIHLINRMRFRRIRWAAMEFLLKSQKKNRRRVIIEQMILLLLRILLVLLAGLLLARFLGSVTGTQQTTRHVVLLDDTLSLSDMHRADGREVSAFSHAKRVVQDLAAFATEATSPQSLTLLRLSDLANPRSIDRLNTATLNELRQYLADIEVSPLHIDMVQGLRAAEAILNDAREERRLLHIVSDFRSADWTGASAEALRLHFEQFRNMKVDCHLIDVAEPVRGENQRTVVSHENLAIVDLVPETRVAARFMPVEFSVGVANYSNAERKNVRVTVRVQGQERSEGSFTLSSVPAGSVTAGTFLIAFDQLGPNHVSVNLEPEEAGLALDNIRHTVVEVREKVPLLIIEGDARSHGTPESDGYFLQQLFSESTRGFEVMSRSPNDLERLDLEQFPSIFLLNVGRLNEKAVAALERYVHQGGGLAFFLGNEVKPDFYEKLYADGKGIFPVPLADRATEPPPDDVKLERLLGNPSPKLYPRNLTHPVLTRIYRDEKTRSPSRENNKYLYFASIDRWWPIRRQAWNVQPGEVEEILTLPNTKQVGDYADQVNRLLRSLPIRDEKYARFRSRLEEYQRQIQNLLLVGGELYKLVQLIDAFLSDTGEANTPSRPNLQEFWQAREQVDLREQMTRLLETVRFGDPFLVAKTVGAGRVLAYLSTADTDWNDLPSGPSRVYWVMLMVEMQKYLAANTSESNRLLGQSVVLEWDPAKYEASVQRFFPPKVDFLKGGLMKYEPIDAGKQQATPRGDRLALVFDEARTPGVYELVFSRKDAPGESVVPRNPAAPAVTATETRAIAFNVDALAESDLRRASLDELAAVVGESLRLHTPGDAALEKTLKDKKSDLSESPWFYLVFLLVLLVEQAMAVRLSYHTVSRDSPPAVGTAAVPTPAREAVGV